MRLAYSPKFWVSSNETISRPQATLAIMESGAVLCHPAITCNQGILHSTIAMTGNWSKLHGGLAMIQDSESPRALLWCLIMTVIKKMKEMEPFYFSKHLEEPSEVMQTKRLFWKYKVLKVVKYDQMLSVKTTMFLSRWKVLFFFFLFFIQDFTVPMQITAIFVTLY